MTGFFQKNEFFKNIDEPKPAPESVLLTDLAIASDLHLYTDPHTAGVMSGINQLLEFIASVVNIRSYY